MSIARCELILGGQRSGKSRRGEMLASAWLGAHASNRAVLIATARAHDDEMRERIARHRRDRAQRVPSMRTVEEPVGLAKAIRSASDANTLVLVDCLTLWLTNILMPLDSGVGPSATAEVDAARSSKQATEALLVAIADVRGPLVLVGNEIGLGVIPMGRETRWFVDSLGRLNQDVAAACGRVTLMVAGLPVTVKDDE